MKVGVDTIKNSKSWKYLGVKFDKKTNFNEQTIAAKRKFNFALSKLRPILRDQDILISIKTRIFTTLLRPIIAYASPAWLSLEGNKANFQKLVTAEMKAIRFTLQKYRRPPDKNGIRKYYSNQSLYNELNLEPLLTYMLRHEEGHGERISIHTNPLVIEACEAAL